jgi:hypothetical protein
MVMGGPTPEDAALAEKIKDGLKLNRRAALITGISALFQALSMLAAYLL